MSRQQSRQSHGSRILSSRQSRSSNYHVLATSRTSAHLPGNLSDNDDTDSKPQWPLPHMKRAAPPPGRRGTQRVKANPKRATGKGHHVLGVQGRNRESAGSRVSRKSDLAGSRASHAAAEVAQKARHSRGVQHAPPTQREWNETPLYDDHDKKSNWSLKEGIGYATAGTAEQHCTYVNIPRLNERSLPESRVSRRPCSNTQDDPISAAEQIFDDLPSRRIGPSRGVASRARTASLPGSEYEQRMSLRHQSMASHRQESRAGDDQPDLGTPAHHEGTHGAISMQSIKRTYIETDSTTQNLHTLGVQRAGLTIKPSSMSMYALPSHVHTGNLQACKSTYSMAHAGANLAGNLHERRVQLNSVRQDNIEETTARLSYSEVMRFHLQRIKGSTKAYIHEAWFNIGFWRSSFKFIEGRFGTAIVAYFNFLHTLLFLNFILTLLTLCFVVAPQLTSQDTMARFLNESTASDWLGKTADAIVGRGVLRTSPVYYGVYSNMPIETYNMPLAYLFIGLAVLVLSFYWVLTNVSKSYQEQQLQKLGTYTKYTNLLFAGWDFSIANEESAIIKSIAIHRDLKEEISYNADYRSVRTWGEVVQLYSKRCVVNLIVLALLGGAGWCIYLATTVSIEASQSENKAGSTSTSGSSAAQIEQSAKDTVFYYVRTLASSLTISVFNAILPLVFEKLTGLENWHSPRKEVKYTLMRTIFVRLASVGVLVVSLYLRLKDCHVKDIDQTPECACWELTVGQEFYQMIFLNFLIVVFATMFGGYTQSLLYRNVKWYRKTIGPPNFPLVRNVLDLLYIQMLVWLGYFFSPVIPAMSVVSLFCFFYVKKWSLLLFMVPSTRPYRAYRNSQLFNGLLLVVLVLSLVPIGFAALEMRPSSKCGPFRGTRYIYSVFVTTLESGPRWINTMFKIITSYAFAVPAFIIVMLLVAYYRVRLRAHGAEVGQLHNQLGLLVADKNFLAENVQAILEKSFMGKYWSSKSSREETRSLQELHRESSDSMPESSCESR